MRDRLGNPVLNCRLKTAELRFRRIDRREGAPMFLGNSHLESMDMCKNDMCASS